MKTKIILAFIAFFPLFINAQNTPETFINPIISGYHPDPSICRVGDDYYLVNSTFAWYPGIPIYHSKDLVNWQLIGHGIHRPDQIDLEGLNDRLGIYAVTIRYNDGKFYLITTCVGCGNNFYITANNPAGPWSDPIWIEGAPGIDPSLMWDEDGKCYYTGHMAVPDAPPGTCAVWNQELDLKNQKLVGRREILTHGHAHNASYTEGPHLYHIDGNYLLMVSEGGTGLYHSLSVHHSDSIWGPYKTDMINPVITHRHLGVDYPIEAIGHGDLVKTQNGEWWCVMLGKRKIEGKTTLGRETFLAKVDFEGKTPIFNKGEGKVLVEQQRPNLPWHPFEKRPSKDEFKGEKLALEWCFIRTPKQNFHNLKEGHLNLNLSPLMVSEKVCPSLIMQRILHHDFEAKSKMKFKSSKANEQAGLVVYRSHENHYLLLKERNELVLIKSFKGVKEELARIPYKKSEVFLSAKGNGLDIQFYYGGSEDNCTPIGDLQSMIVIADGNGNQFTGPGIGMYATSNGKATKGVASFDWFEYKESH